MAQVRRLGPKVGSRLALFCIHRVNRVNSRNDSQSAPYHKHRPVIIFSRSVKRQWEWALLVRERSALADPYCHSAWMSVGLCVCVCVCVCLCVRNFEVKYLGNQRS